MRRLALLCCCCVAILACGDDASSGAGAAGGAAGSSAGSSGKSGSAGKGGTSGKGGSAGKGGSTLCIPGKQDACACLGGTGVQVCAEDGRSYSDCECPSGGAGGGEIGGAGGSSAGAGGSSAGAGGSDAGTGGTEAGAAGSGLAGTGGTSAGAAGSEAGAAGSGLAGTGGSDAGGGGTSAGAGGSDAGAGGSGLAGTGGTSAGTGGTTAGTGGTSAGTGGTTAGTGGTSAGTGGTTAGTGGTTAGTGGTTAGTGGTTAGTGGVGGSGVPGDTDGDGWTAAAGDCNDTNPLVNPGAFDIPANGLDDNCNGAIDEATQVCDTNLGPVLSSAVDAARAMGLCDWNVAVGKPGVVAASFANLTGPFLSSPPVSTADTTLQLGALPDFGAATSPREGSRMLAMSSGIARTPSQAGGAGVSCTSSKQYGTSPMTAPPGFPKKNSCGDLADPYDGIGIDLQLRVPTNARSFRVKYRYFSCEYPQWVCSKFGDVFAILMSPSPLAADHPMVSPNGALADVAFEDYGTGLAQTINVNNTSFFTACTTTATTASYTLCSGDAPLAGTGFEGAAATGWLETRVAVPTFAPGADRLVSIRLAVWDGGDATLDSTVAIDAFEWSADEVTTATKLLP